MKWQRSWKADPMARQIADRHYNRQNPNSKQFVPPGKAMILALPGAVWVTSNPLACYVRHAWAGAWVNSLFRNERPDLYLSSELIRDAVACSRYVFGDPPPLGMITFVDSDKVRSKRNPGYCYLRAGFKNVGTTQGGLIALQLQPGDFPDERRIEGRFELSP